MGKKCQLSEPKTWNFLQTGIQLVIGFLDLFRGKFNGSYVKHNLGFLKVSFLFLEFYLCYDLLEALLR